MTYRLSILDKSPIADGASAAETLATTLSYAELAEKLGYHRFWVAEHHGSKELASVAPEILVSHLAARTKHIRLGTGGVLLQHYSPFKVAEIFSVLALLAPDRIDLGIGRAPGGLPFGTKALQSEFSTPRAQFNDKLRDLDLFLKQAAPQEHVLAQAEVSPRAQILPERFLLGSSETSATLAASLGWGFVYAGHQDGDSKSIDRSLTAYGSGGSRPILAIAAFAAPTREQALAVAERRSFKVSFADGHSVNLGSTDAAQEYARQLGAEPVKVEERRPQLLAGTPDDIHAELLALSQRHGVEEFILDSPVADRKARLQSIELIANARQRAVD